MGSKRIYIADDEANILNIMSVFLEREGFSVTAFTNGQALVDAFRESEPDLVIVDIMMPKLDGFSASSIIRQVSTVPIIIVSAKDAEADRVAGLTLGGDDYLTKPFSPLELVARVKSLFRRVEMESNRHAPSPFQKVADIVIDPYGKQVTCRGIELQLTGLEFAMLHYMVENRYRAVSRAELLDKVWGFETAVETRATDDTVKRLRRKLAAAGSVLKIETVWGYGFRLEEKD